MIWRLALGGLAIAACAANLCLLKHDLEASGGTDLRARVVGVRAWLDGRNPYTLSQSPRLEPRLQDPDQVELSRCTYPPTLLLVYGIAASLDYSKQRVIWAVAEWLALLGSILLLSASINSRRSRIWFLIGAVGLFGGSTFWRAHVQQGQYYVFILLLLSLGYYSWRRLNSATITGICLGLACSLRPTAILVLVAFAWRGPRRLSMIALLTTTSFVLATLPFGEWGYWGSYLQLSKKWELVVLGTPILPPPSVEAAEATLVDGYRSPRTPNQLKNVSLASILRGMSNDANANEETARATAVLIKALWVLTIVAWAALTYAGTAAYAGTPTTDRTHGSRFLWLAAIMGMLWTDFFVPIRIGYADILYLLPLSLFHTTMLQPRNRVLMLALAALYASQTSLFSWLVPSSGELAGLGTSLRSLGVMYLGFRCLIEIARRRFQWKNLSTAPTQ